MFGVIAPIMLEWNISLGNVLATASILITLFTLHSANVKRWTRAEERLEILWRDYLARHGIHGGSDGR